MEKKFIINVNDATLQIEGMKGSDVINNLVKHLPALIDNVLDIMCEGLDDRGLMKHLAVNEIIKRLTEGKELYDVTYQEVNKG